MNKNFTDDDVKTAVIAKKITYIPVNDCAICGATVFYRRDGMDLYFCGACDCSWSPPERRGWEELADWINMQTNPKARKIVAELCGIDLENEPTP